MFSLVCLLNAGFVKFRDLVHLDDICSRLHFWCLVIWNFHFVNFRPEYLVVNMVVEMLGLWNLEIWAIWMVFI